MGEKKEGLAAYELALQMHPAENLFIQGLAKAKASLLEGKSAAEILKMQGNDSFKKGEIENAKKFYTQAIAAIETKTDEGKKLAADIYANRAAVYRQLYLSDKVVADCTEALKLAPQHVKALIRRAQAYEGLEKYQAALSDFEHATRLGGGSLCTQGASRCRKAVRMSGKQTSR